MFDQRLNQLSAQITKMTPQQRQQFAAMHRNDPILVSLTKFVNDQDQAVRNGMLAAKAPEMTRQPKVVDQTIAQMGAPQGGPMITPPPRASQAGVAGLPAPNLAGMPDGGIAGQPDQAPQAPSFAAGGAVRYAGGGGIIYGPMGIPITGPDDKELYGYSPSDRVSPTGKPAKKADAKGGRPVMRDDPRLLGPIQSPFEQLRERNMAEVNAVPATPAAPAPAAPSQDDKVRDMMMKLLAGDGGAAPVATPGVGSGGTGAPRAGGLAALAPAAGADPQLDINAAFDQRMAQLPKEVAPDQREGLAAARSAMAQDDLTELERQRAERGVAGSDREKRLTERASKLDAAENENKGLALLSAGLAMMAGTSPNAFANIGQGAQVGVKQFQEGKARLDAARERLDDSFFQLEEIRRNEKRLDDKELREAKRGVRSAVVENMQDAYKAVADMYGVNAKTAMGMVDAAVKQQGQQLEASTRLQAAQIGANAQVQSAGIHAGASAAASRESAAAHRYSAQVHGLGALLRNDPSDPMRQAKFVSDLRAKVANEVKNDPSGKFMFDAGAQEAEINRRLGVELNRLGMPQFAGPSSAAPPADLSGWGEPKLVK